ncbi:TPA: 1-(5-phosphoribosyl)-5-[(5-phosphoribosylamino)methylideneamino]imidazole-4-carboxamide isomerase [bacterium]|nr:1-(5-phosphoribosyl)-5-[(5-phosphoribosylamino)methylideneamino]imidazole-4-carboxamide isomerase [bacterium]
MLVIPAIDLKNGQVVRLRQGRPEDETVYSSKPEDAALLWQRKGARRLHIVDLDGAFEGSPKNIEVIRRILAAVEIPVELGGGIRRMEDIEEVLSLGVEWAILGTSIILNPELIREAAKRFPGRILVGVDVRRERISIKGWQDETRILTKDLFQGLEETGIAGIIYTDILRDGMMRGPNFEGIAELIRTTTLEVIASGGISSMQDIEKLKRLNLKGVIVGRALYDGAIDLEEAVKSTTGI